MIVSTKLRLSVMIFLQYFTLGATVPIFSLYLTRNLLFSGTQAGTIFSMSAVAAFVSPFVGAFIADRLISATRLYALCHLIAGVLMALLSLQRQFELFLFIYLIYMLSFVPTHALSNAIAFHHLPDSQHSFGGIRMWGTIGWIAVAWVFGFFWLQTEDAAVAGRLADALRLSAISSVLLGLYALTLPVQRIESNRPRRIIPVESFRVMISRNVLVLSFISFLISFINRFYYFGTGPFLRQIGFRESVIMPAMSLGQVPEVFAMALLGLLLKHYGLKRVIAMGIFMELLRFSSFAIGQPKLLVLAGICFHGLAFTFFFTTALICLDGYCNESSRAGAHQLFAIITSGFASFCGSLVSGKIMDVFTITENGIVDFRAFWVVPAGLSLFALVILVLFFHEKKKIEEKNRI
ncbi:MAG: MFS transporter [Deltaproteobacteria bacterium]|nr:MFS transporter [Deltaproteobacteria bacterium]MBW2153579.1 MFS transporter [Deltaproteobacteria bacterium]